MAFYSLPLEKNNVKVPEEYCYLVIVKYQDDNFKPSKGKKLSAEESKKYGLEGKKLISSYVFNDI